MDEHFVDVVLTVVVTALQKHKILPAADWLIVERLGPLCSVPTATDCGMCTMVRAAYRIDKWS
jgi:hypothetical protein